jgi:hypothetical protein
VKTNVLIKEECILKNKNKLCACKKLSVFYNSCLKNFGSHLVYIMLIAENLGSLMCMFLCNIKPSLYGVSLLLTNP